MDAINSGDEWDHVLVSTEMLEDIRDGGQTHPNVNRIEARYKIRDSIRQRQPEWKWVLKATQSMGKVLHKVFSTVVKDISQELTPLGYKIRDYIKQRQSEWKVGLKATQNMGKGLHKVFKAVVKDISQ